MKGRLQKMILPAALMILGLGASAGLSNYAGSVRPALPEGYGDSDLSIRPSSMRGYLLGMEGLVADWYFVRALQYIGDKLVRVEGDINLDDLRWLDPRLLYPLLDEATSLDPHFTAAYTYGAVVMPAIDPEKAIAIAKKGIDNNPNEWRLYQYLGYVYWRQKRYGEAADAFQAGSEIAGAAPFMRMMAGSMRTEGGSRATARAIFTQMLADSDDEQVRGIAGQKLRDLDSLDEREAIDGVLATFRERNGRCAASLNEISPLLMQVRLPGGREFRVDNQGRLVDPNDKVYVLDKQECRLK